MGLKLVEEETGQAFRNQNGKPGRELRVGGSGKRRRNLGIRFGKQRANMVGRFSVCNRAGEIARRFNRQLNRDANPLR